MDYPFNFCTLAITSMNTFCCTLVHLLAYIPQVCRAASPWAAAWQMHVEQLAKAHAARPCRTGDPTCDSRFHVEFQNHDSTCGILDLCTYLHNLSTFGNGNNSPSPIPKYSAVECGALIWLHFFLSIRYLYRVAWALIEIHKPCTYRNHRGFSLVVGSNLWSWDEGSRLL